MALLIAALPSFFWMYVVLHNDVIIPGLVLRIAILGGCINMTILALAFLMVVFAMSMKDIIASDKMVYKP